MKRRSTNCAGFAAVTSIVLLGLVALALTAIASLTALEARRTHAEASRAQLRQLLLAGAADVQAHSLKWGDAAPTEDWRVSLPSDLSGDHALLACHCAAGAADGEARVTVDAALERDHASQVLQLRHDNGHWRIASAELQP